MKDNEQLTRMVRALIYRNEKLIRENEQLKCENARLKTKTDIAYYDGSNLYGLARQQALHGISPYSQQNIESASQDLCASLGLSKLI